MSEKKDIYIPVKDYATLNNISVQNVYDKIKRGKLKGRKLGNYQLVRK